MKLSTKIMKYVDYEDCVGKGIMLMVDCGTNDNIDTITIHESTIENTLKEADKWHRYLTEEKKCTLLPLNECPVVNDKNIVMHYTSTTYREWLLHC